MYKDQIDKYQQSAPEIAITNLSFRTKVDDIYDVFSQFGEMTQCRLMINERNESKGYAFIAYKSHQASIQAIQSMNDFHIDGHSIKVSWSSGQSVTMEPNHPKPHEYGYKSSY